MESFLGMWWYHATLFVYFDIFNVYIPLHSSSHSSIAICRGSCPSPASSVGKTSLRFELGPAA
jgi:hypothetical protein